MDMQKFCFGVDIGGTSMKMGLFAYDRVLRDARVRRYIFVRLAD